MDLEMDKEDLLSGPYHSQQHYHSCLMWFKIVTLTIRTVIGEGPNTRGGGRVPQSQIARQRRQAPSVRQLKRLAHAV